MGFFGDLLSGGAEGASSSATGDTGSGFSWTSILPSLINAGSSAINQYTAPDPIVAYGNTEAGFNSSQALERDKMTQALEIARMQMSAGNAGAGAAVAAARIAQQTALKQLREKAVADKIADQLDLRKTESGNAQAAVNAASNSRLATGQGSQKGFTDAAEILSRYKM